MCTLFEWWFTVRLIVTFITVLVLEGRWVVLGILLSFLVELIPVRSSVWWGKSSATMRYFISDLTDHILTANRVCIVWNFLVALLHLVQRCALWLRALLIWIQVLIGTIHASVTLSIGPLILVEADFAWIRWKSVLDLRLHLRRRIAVVDFGRKNGARLWKTWVIVDGGDLRCSNAESPNIVHFRVVILE